MRFPSGLETKRAKTDGNGSFLGDVVPSHVRVRLLVGAGLFVSLFIVGILGYVLVEGWPFMDALYMTAMTVTTVGFREVRPLSTAGQIFTVLLAIFGVGLALYILTMFVAAVLEADLRSILGVRRMKSQIGKLRNHYILCGFGRVGEEIALEFAERGIPFVIVENNPEAIERSRRYDYLLIEGDASQDVVLQEAGIDRARVLLAASDSDSGNTYITLTARALNPTLLIVSRVGKPQSEARMLRAGADRVISPYSLAGRRMALSALQPLTVDFIDTMVQDRKGGQILAEVKVAEESVILGRRIEEVVQTCCNTTVLGIKRGDGSMLVGPEAATVLEIGDRLMVLGSEEDVTVLSRATPGAGSESLAAREAASELTVRAREAT